MAGVQIDGNGYSWLQILATNKTVHFVPLNNEGNECVAKVYLTEPGKKTIDVGRALVGLGFAKASPLAGNIGPAVKQSFENYERQLKLSELKAKSLRKGQWSSLPESWIRWFTRTTIEKIIFNMKPMEKKLPSLVR